MKTLSELRSLFVAAREIAKEASPARAQEAAELLGGISAHCKELYGESKVYMERAMCRNLFESIDNVIEILNRQGFCHATVAAFFGLGNGKGVSFSDVAGGKATIRRAELPEEPVEAPVAHLEEPAASAPSLSAKTVKTPPAAGSVPAAETPAAPATETPVAPAAQGIPMEGDEMAPQSLDEFIGQAHIVCRLKQELEAARIQGKRHLDHILLFGTCGLGKTTLMRLIAKELGVAYEFFDCTSMKNDVRSQRSFEEMMIRLSESGKPVAIGMDEIHKLSDSIQSNLLTLLQDRVYNYHDANGVGHNLYFPELTFIGATTDYNRVLGTIKDRCSNLLFHMVDYTREEMTKILVNKLAMMGMTAEPEVLTECVNRCRSSVRDIVAIVKGLHTKAVIRRVTEVSMDMAMEYFRERGLDEIGMKEPERRLLNIVASEPRGSVSADAIAARLHMDVSVMIDEHEPFLMKIGFLTVSSKGRSITDRARDYLKYGYFQYDDGFTIGSKPSPNGDDPTPAAEPAPVEPAPVEPAPVEPTPVEPAPVEPIPVEPAPAEELPVEDAPSKLPFPKPLS